MDSLPSAREETERIQSLHERLMARTAQIEHIIDMDPMIRITLSSGESCDFKVALARLHTEALADPTVGLAQRLFTLLSQAYLS